MVTGAVARRQRTEPKGVFHAIEEIEAPSDKSWLREMVPDIITFIVSEQYLNRPNLYPRQATLLKIIFLEDGLFTQYDLDVIHEWIEEYKRTANEKGEGSNGIVPDVLERIKINRTCPCSHDRDTHMVPELSNPGGRCAVEGCDCKRYRGRWWFREVISVIGRRGSKNHIGALCGAYILWHYIKVGDPQGMYGVDRDKRLQAIVFGGKKEQAKANQWRDLNNVIMGAPCFSPYISRPLGESLTVFAPFDQIRQRERDQRVDSDQDIATFEIVPRESTLIAARGPASFMQFYDEAAHVVKGVANTPAEDVYESATPALDQFGREAFIYIPSSPWQMIGLFYDKYQQAIETEEDGTAIYPEMLMIQLTSWDIYKDWEVAHEKEMWPPGYLEADAINVGRRTFLPLQKAIQEYDHDMEKLERANPDTFRVERRSQFAAVLDAYLHPDRIATIWESWPDPEGPPLQIRDHGQLDRMYRAHGDPSKSGAGFGFAIAHVEQPGGSEFPHVVFDVLHAWLPENYEGHQVDYDDIGKDLRGYLDNFMPFEMTFDQFNSVGTIQMLQKHARRQRYPKQVQVYERPATGPLNWKTYECFKTALGLGLIHAPYFDLANLELTFLQVVGHQKVDCPEAGPVQTKDVADCMAIVTYELIGDQMSAFLAQELSDFKMGVAAPGGMDAYRDQREDAHQKLSDFGKARGRYPKQG